MILNTVHLRTNLDRKPITNILLAFFSSLQYYENNQAINFFKTKENTFQCYDGLAGSFLFISFSSFVSIKSKCDYCNV